MKCMNKTQESLKIISNGISTEIYLDGKLVQGVRSLNLSQSLDEMMILNLELVILPNHEGEKL